MKRRVGGELTYAHRWRLEGWLHPGVKVKRRSKRRVNRLERQAARRDIRRG